MPSVDPPSTRDQFIPAPLRSWAITIGVWMAALTAYVVIGLMGIAITNNPIAGAMIANVGVFGVIWWFRRHRIFTQLTGHIRHRRIDLTPRQFWVWFGSGILVCWLGGQVIAAWVYTLLGSPGFDAVSQTRIEAPLIIILIASVIAAPMGEEALLRGIAYPLLRRHWPPLAAGFVTAALFGILHGNLVQCILTLPLGIFLAFVYEHTQRLRWVIIAHIIFNLCSTITPVDWITTISTGPIALVLGIAVCGVLIVMHPVHDVPDQASPGIR